MFVTEPYAILQTSSSSIKNMQQSAFIDYSLAFLWNKPNHCDYSRLPNTVHVINKYCSLAHNSSALPIHVEEQTNFIDSTTSCTQIQLRNC